MKIFIFIEKILRKLLLFILKLVVISLFFCYKVPAVAFFIIIFIIAILTMPEKEKMLLKQANADFKHAFAMQQAKGQKQINNYEEIKLLKQKQEKTRREYLEREFFKNQQLLANSEESISYYKNQIKVFKDNPEKLQLFEKNLTEEEPRLRRFQAENKKLALELKSISKKF